MRPLRSVALTFDRTPGGLLLSTEAGWNQIADDWRFMLCAGTSYGFADSNDHLVATGLTVEFAHYGWISMILVTAPYRRRGLATQLMGRCVDALASRRLVPALDASPDGREVYRRLGFRDVGNSTRLVGTLAREVKHTASDIFKLTAAELPEIAAFDAEFVRMARDDAAVRRLMTIPGIGTINATALAAAVGDARTFGRGRDMAAWLGLTPRQMTTGGKPRLLGISKRGNRYLRKNLIHGARAVLPYLVERETPLGRWARGLLARTHKNVVVVALANKLARIAWAVLAHGGTYDAGCEAAAT